MYSCFFNVYYLGVPGSYPSQEQMHTHITRMSISAQAKEEWGRGRKWFTIQDRNTVNRGGVSETCCTCRAVLKCSVISLHMTSHQSVNAVHTIPAWHTSEDRAWYPCNLESERSPDKQKVSPICPCVYVITVEFVPKHSLSLTLVTNQFKALNKTMPAT